MIRLATTLLLLAAFIAPAHAAEDLPNLDKLKPKEQEALKAYHDLSNRMLKDTLTPMVEKTREGEIFLGAQWERESTVVIARLGELRKIDLKDDTVKTWLRDELHAWVAVRTIGVAMMDHHYLMATTHEDIAQDAKDCEAFFTLWKGKVSKTNDAAGRVNKLVSKLNEVTGEFDQISGIMGGLSGELGKLQEHAALISRLLRVFRAKKFTFIKQKDLRGKYRDRLSKLKSRQIDPSGVGVFNEYEKDWEETMTRTYQSYVHAVDDWNKAARWWLTKDEALSTIFKYGSKLAKISATGMLGIPVPDVTYADPEKLGDVILKMKYVLTKAADKARGMEWARLENLELDAEEQIRTVELEFRLRVEKAEMAARMKAVDVEEKCEKILEQIEKDLIKAHRDLGKAGEDQNKERAAWVKIRKLEAQVILEERAEAKEKRYWLEDWYEKQQEEAYRERRAKIDKLEKYIKELESKKPRR